MGTFMGYPLSLLPEEVHYQQTTLTYLWMNTNKVQSYLYATSNLRLLLQIKCIRGIHKWYSIFWWGRVKLDFPYLKKFFSIGSKPEIEAGVQEWLKNGYHLWMALKLLWKVMIQNSRIVIQSNPMDFILTQIWHNFFSKVSMYFDLFTFRNM